MCTLRSYVEHVQYWVAYLRKEVVHAFVNQQTAERQINKVVLNNGMCRVCAQRKWKYLLLLSALQLELNLNGTAPRWRG